MSVFSTYVPSLLFDQFLYNSQSQPKTARLPVTGRIYSIKAFKQIRQAFWGHTFPVVGKC